MASGEAKATRSRWLSLRWALPVAIALAVVVVLVAKALRGTPAVQDFITHYPGDSKLPAGTPIGFPAWLQWQHFLNSFFILFVIRTGWQIRTVTRPRVFWTRTNEGFLRTANPPVRITLPTWFHLSLTVLWVLDGLVFYVLLFASGQWQRVVPTGWDVFPNAVSAGIQYASLQWPTANGWVNYNGLQLLSYFATIFIAAPLAIVTGLRMAPGFAARLRPLDRVFSPRAARGIHFGVMVYFVAFIVVHVTLVLATGAVRNLNHMYAGRDDQNWIGFALFAGSIVVMIVGWVAARPTFLAAIASSTGTVIRR